MSIGQRLGHYQILAKLGAGGMGEVYLAEDTTLGRQVALKILPPEMAAPGRRERFDREARAVAALNHPNIVTIHSIDESGGTPFLTMEYVDGKQLGELIPPNGLPLDRLLKIAIPLADAVGAAHQRGILHRDLKPANVMVTAEGRVKVLDFGLAKLQEDIDAREALPTQDLTGEGRIVGTVAYMSPEQAEGKAVDQRSDVFSIGVMLYELATGKRPFTGDTSLSVLSAILKESPTPVGEIKPGLPRDFTRIIRRALNKDPEQRYQSAKDLRNDLSAVLDDLASGELARPAPVGPAAATSPGSRRTMVALAVTGALGAAAVAGWVLTRSAAPATVPAPASDSWAPSRLTSNGLSGPVVAVSPDGRYVAYPQIQQGGPSLLLRQIATGADVVVRPPERVGYDGLAFSPDGNFIYYSTYPVGDNAATLYRVPAIGGVPQKILTNLDTSVAFSPDGRRLAFIVNYPSEQRSTLEVANADGTGRATLAERKRPDQFLATVGARPAWSPDGSTIAAPVVDGPGQTFALVDAANGAMRMLGEKRWPFVSSAHWLAGNRELAVAYRESGTGTQLWRVNVQTGTATAITRDLFNYADFGVTADGETIVGLAALGESTLWTAEAGRPGDLVQISTGGSAGEGSLGVSWTPDGHIVFASQTTGNPDLWSLDAGSGTRRQLTADPGDDRQPAVSPDGRSIAFVSNRQGGNRVWLMHADGSEPRAVSAGPGDSLPFWTPDSRTIMFLSASAIVHQINADGSGERSLKAMWPPRAGEPAKTFIPRAVSREGLVAGFEETDAQRGGGWRLAFGPLDASRPTTLLDVTTATAIASNIAWAPDGKAVDIVRGPGGNLWRYPIDGRPAVQLTEFTGPGVIRSFAWSANGRLLMSRGENKTDVVLFRRAASVNRP